MNTRQVQTALNALGFPCGAVDGLVGRRTRGATARFQLAYNVGTRLAVDGVAGPLTTRALTQAADTRRLSPHFSVAELRSGGDGTCYVHRSLLTALETMRARLGRPVVLRSGWRDPAHNRRVGGASASQHAYGTAAELARLGGTVDLGPHGVRAGRAADLVAGYADLATVRGLRLFSGIGHRGTGTPWVMHVDTRTGATPAAPIVWRY